MMFGFGQMKYDSFKIHYFIHTMGDEVPVLNDVWIGRNERISIQLQLKENEDRNEREEENHSR